MNWQLHNITWEAITAIVELFVIMILLFEIRENRSKIQEDNQIIILQFYSRFVERYQEIMNMLPSDVYSREFNMDNIENRESFMRAMRSYFDLCSQEYFLYKKGKLNEEIWKEWEEGIISSINLPAFKHGWLSLPSSESTYNDFKSYIERNIN